VYCDASGEAGAQYGSVSERSFAATCGQQRDAVDGPVLSKLSPVALPYGFPIQVVSQHSEDSVLKGTSSVCARSEQGPVGGSSARRAANGADAMEQR
jgi:hypothetical protein